MLVLLCTVWSGFGQVNESFSNIGTSSSSYSTRTWIGDDNYEWTANDTRTDQNLTGRAITIRTGSFSNDNPIPNGCGTITFDYKKAFTGNSTLKLFINGLQYGGDINVNSSSETTFTYDVNEGGPINFELENSGNRTVVDNLTWTTFTVCTPPPNPTGTISGITPSCNATNLSYTGPALAYTINYWQTSTTGTATTNNTGSAYAATSTGTYYVRAYNTVSSCWSTGAVSYDVSINTLPTISSSPINATRVIPNTASFSVTATGSPSPTYQWEVSDNGGSTWTNVIDGSGATSTNYTTTATSASMHTNLYRCVVTNTCGAVTSNTATLTLSNPSPVNVNDFIGCFQDTSVALSWNPPSSGTTPSGYIIFAKEGATDPAGSKTDANSYTSNTNFSLATPVTPASLGRVVYKGTGASTVVTGLAEDTNYSFSAYSYVGETLTGWAGGATNGSTITNALAQGDVRNLVATSLTSQVTLNWLNPLPTSCWDDIMIVANEGAVTFTPTGNGSAYTANSVYSGANSIVYKGSANSVAITGLTNGTNYCFKAFIRRGTTWTEGVAVCAVPSLTYCNASGNTSYDTGITGVVFNTINNIGTSSTNAYTDFTSISTNVTLGASYNLGVIVNIDGVVSVYTKVWIDWNQDGNFNGAGEVYDLGSDQNTNASVDLNTATSNSPINLEIPNNAVIGATRMRVFTQYNTSPTPCSTGNSGEVEDYTIIVDQPVGAEMNIKGNTISIANGFNAPYGLNNTLFGSTNVGGTGPEKTFLVENIGLTSLSLTGVPKVEIIGANPGDFIVTMQPSTVIGASSNSSFKIQFFPISDGTRNATVRILNTDADENPYEFDIKGTGVCSGTLASTIFPIEGPENTEVTITSPNNLTSASATLNGITMPTISSTATELVVLVPAEASSGNIQILFSTGCSSVKPFTVIDNLLNGCESSTSSTFLEDLFISKLSDATTGTSSIIEIYNGTSNTITLDGNYSIRIFNNGNSSPQSTNPLTGSIASGDVHVLAIGSTSCDISDVDIDQSITGISGINFDFNSSDAIGLYKNSTSSDIDVLGIISSNSWANGLVAGGDGVIFKRKNDASPLPNQGAFSIDDFILVDWSTCSDSDYSEFGAYDFSLAVSPTVSILNNPVTNCSNLIQLSITASEGVPEGSGLSYSWYFLVPGNTSFVPIPDNDDFDDVNTSDLSIINPFLYESYQFYCRVQEGNASCYSASNAVKLSFDVITWDGVWLSSPTGFEVVIINADYDTSTDVDGQTSFTACKLIVNAGSELTIGQGDYVEVDSDVTVDGAIIIKPTGSFVQVNNSGLVQGAVLGDRTKISVEKRTAPLATSQEYTYWSSPVQGESIMNGLNEASTNRRYKYIAQNYLDATMESSNNNATLPGQDDVDDNGDDWEQVSGTDVMETGVGYAATHGSSGFMPGQFIYTFEGPFNNGVIEVPIYRNDDELNDNNWNFIGNPYPSAIDADEFLEANASIDPSVGATNGAIYFWSHHTMADDNTNGNDVFNYSQSDYAIINGSGQTAGGDEIQPSRNIPSGQGFFICMSNGVAATAIGDNIFTTNVVFDNNMRVREEGDNSQFFRSSSNDDNRLHLNLTSDNGIFNQILIAYVEGATNGDDGMYYDAPKNLSSDANAVFYSTINGDSEGKFAIQGKPTSSLDPDEVILLGFYTAIEEATLYTISIAQLEGEFLSTTSIYLKDNFLNTVHNLSLNDYNFASETGTFNDRFEIVFSPATLSSNQQRFINSLQILELNDGRVQFSVAETMKMDRIEILDLLGRTLYDVKCSSFIEILELTQLSQAAYVAKVTLSNGQVIIKKALKRM